MDLNTSIRRLKFYWATELLNGASLQEGGNAFATSIFGDFDKDVFTALKTKATKSMTQLHILNEAQPKEGKHWLQNSFTGFQTILHNTARK